MSARLEKHPLPAPLFVPALACALGIVAGRYLSCGYLIPAIISGLLLIVAFFIKPLRNLCILLLFVALGCLRWEADTALKSPLQKTLNAKGRVQQVVKLEVLRPLSESSYEVRLKEIAGFPAKDKLRLLDDAALPAGSRLSGLAEITEATRDPILNLFPGLGTGSIRMLTGQDSLSQVPGKENLIIRSTAFINRRLEPLPQKDQDLARALLLSDPISKQAHRESLSRAGISHLIVVSGLHVLMLYLIIITILRFFLPHRLADIAFILVILFFAALNHWAAPISRAILMILVSLAARWLSRPVATKQSLAISFLILILVAPAQLFDIGFQLSFTSVAIIIFAVPHLLPAAETGFFKRNLMYLGEYLLLSLSVALGFCPFTLYYFGTASFNSLIANLLGLPIIYGLLGLALALILVPIKPFYLSFSYVAELWEGWLSFSAALPFHLKDFWLPFSRVAALMALFILFALLIKRRWKVLRYAALPLMALFFTLWFWHIPFRDRIIVFNAGTADCSLIFSGKGESIMIDSGGIYGTRAESSLLDVEDIYQNSWLRQRLLPWLKRNRLQCIDYLLLTHLHSDHASGLPALVKHLRIRNLILSESDLQSEEWQHLSQGLSLSQTRIIAVTDTFSLFFGKQRLKILHPDTSFTAEDENNRSIVCRWDSGKSRSLFTGDLEALGELYLAQKYPHELKADYLKIAHHGSRGSSSESWLDAVKPSEAWITCSRKNVYGFPHAETLNRLQERNIRTLYSYEGSINIPAHQLP
ncbi:MAG: DNA internalization-related competence protein ComEC/Rec2 [Candidatus Cloacimonetes bacterium]|nr:DNA internalization-related competence protein ComEC/Rec2 [Candidatus Cloacimonadota bacterium]